MRPDGKARRVRIREYLSEKQRSQAGCSAGRMQLDSHHGLPGCGTAGHMGIEENLYFISVAARMLGMHPQTLRKYERLGLVKPGRTIGSIRLYSQEELERLRLIKHLVDEGGINLAGVQRMLSIAEVVQRIRPLMRDEPLSARDARRLSQELDELTRMLGFD